MATVARNRLPYVQRRRRADGTLSFRGWGERGGRRVYSPWCTDELAAHRAALRIRAAMPEHGETLDEAVEHVLAELRLKRTAGTVRWYQDHFRALRRLIPGETPIAAISPATVEQFVRDRLAPGAGGRRVTPATVNADLRALHRVFAVAIRRGIVQANPVRNVDRPRADAPAMDWFRDDEFRDLLGRVADPHARDVLLLFALTGLRRAEAARLELGHVRFHLRQIVVAGKRGTRVVPIADDLDTPLRRLVARAGAGPQLLPGGVHAIDDLFRALRRELGDRRLHPHALRHTFGTALIRAGTRPDVAMRLLGHRSLQTTLRYVHEVGQEGAHAISSLRLVPPDASRSAQQP